ncbi:MAG TPA: hypothetical protein VFM32_07740 [Spongiibacteraceae bacterium]|nr:hypothetical protein [Spongiibacteraceae bacterium]
MLLCGSSVFIVNAYAQDKDVDQADTLDFEAFHKDKNEAVRAWDKNSSTTTKAYSDQPTSSDTAVTMQKTAASTAPETKSAASDISGKRFEMRERYTLTRSAKTPYSAFYVIEPLYKQAAQLCPKGWKKLAERSEPIEQDFYLYYEIECL